MNSLEKLNMLILYDLVLPLLYTYPRKILEHLQDTCTRMFHSSTYKSENKPSIHL